jgi:hypothetical protein
MFMLFELGKMNKICTCTIGNFSYKSHANLIPNLFTYLNSFSSIPLNENKGSLVNGVPKI